MSDDLRFDQMLTEDITALPPALTVVSPWREAMSRILWGIGLTTITLNFLYLDIILPAIGALLMVLGFRTLRNENAPLRWCWWLSMAMAALRGITCVLPALPVETYNIPAYGIMALTLALYVCLWRGMVAVSRAAGAEKPGAPAAGALVWFYALMCPLAFVGLEGWLAVLPLLVIYILILRSLVRLSRSLADTGYVITAAQVKLPSAAVLWGGLGLMLAATVLAMLLGQRCSMEWRSRDDAPQDAAIRQQLLELGFPRRVLDDLTADEVAEMKDATAVYTEFLPLYNGEGYRVVTTDRWSDESPNRWVYQDAIQKADGSYSYLYHVYDFYDECVTCVVVELPEESGQRRYLLVSYLEYTTPPESRYVEALDIWPPWQWSQEDYRAGDLLSGRLLCRRDGQEQTADFDGLTSGTGEVSNIFGTYTQSNVTARWTYPSGGENVRLYVLYDALRQPDAQSLYQMFNYLRQEAPLYPAAQSLWDRRRSSAVTLRQSDYSVFFWQPEEGAE